MLGALITAPLKCILPLLWDLPHPKKLETLHHNRSVAVIKTVQGCVKGSYVYWFVVVKNQLDHKLSPGFPCRTRED